MRSLILLALILSSTISIGQPNNSVYLGNGIYGNKNYENPNQIQSQSTIYRPIQIKEKVQSTETTCCDINSTLLSGNVSFGTQFNIDNGITSSYFSRDGVETYLDAGSLLLSHFGTVETGSSSYGEMRIGDIINPLNYFFILSKGITGYRIGYAPDHNGTLETNDFNVVSILVSGSIVSFPNPLTYTPNYIIPIPKDSLTGNAFIGWYLISTTPTNITIGLQNPISGTLNFIWKAQ